MGRSYLTPSMVTLLALVCIYSEGAVPHTEITHILSFLVQHISFNGQQANEHDEQASDHGTTLPISKFESYLSGRPSSIPGRSIWDLLLKRLWTIDCSAALDVFIEDLPLLLAKTREQMLLERDTGQVSDQPGGKILRTSPLGVFIRRCHLEYVRMQFQHGIQLWQELIAYRQQTRAAYEKKNNADNRNVVDINLADLNIDASHPLAQIVFGCLDATGQAEDTAHSVHDAEALFEFQVSEMQRLGGRLPDHMRETLKQMTTAGSNPPKLTYYLKFLDSWRAGDYSSAFDNLHRYFDYTMHSRDRTFYQYALLNLAILQADFGCHSEAIPAIQEAIATARENRDTVCLNFCMSWLYHFGRAFPAEMKGLRENGILGSEVEGLAFLKTRAKDAEMWSLLSTCLLSEAKLGLQNGDSLAVVFENIVKASHINNVKAVQNVVGLPILMKGSAFGRIGQTHMSKLCCETFLDCYGGEASIEDVLKCYCLSASLLVQQGRYSEAEATMSSVPDHILKVLKLKNNWLYHSSFLRLRRLLYRDDLEAAAHIVKTLNAQGSSNIETEFCLKFLEVELLVRKGDLEDALDLVEELADRAQLENHDIAIRTRLMTTKASLWQKSGHAMKGFSLIMRAANLAYSARLLPSLWEAINGLTMILLELQEWDASQKLLEAILPQVMECQDCEMAGRTHSLLADAHMGLAGCEEADSIKRKENMAKAMEHLNAALEQFKFVEDLQGQLEMLNKTAKIQYFRGDLVLANDTASRYLETRNEYIASRN